jgi:hypothetical protein
MSAIICKFSTVEECHISVCAGGAAEFIKVPQHFQTEEMCIRAVMDDPNMINYIRPDLLTYEINIICQKHKQQS